MKNNLKRIVLRASALSAIAAGGLGIVGTPLALAHDVPCPLCGLKVVQGTKTQDNEVVLRYGKKKIEYRCIYCVFADAKKYDGDLTVYAPSETKDKPVLLRREAGKWRAVKDVDGKLVPEDGVVFLNAFVSHKDCAALSRAFHTKAGFDAYKAKAKDAQPLTLEAMLDKVAAK